jgi:hypothetical protein
LPEGKSIDDETGAYRTGRIIARVFENEVGGMLKIFQMEIKNPPSRRILLCERAEIRMHLPCEGSEPNLVSAERFELSTNGLKGHCSAIELRAHEVKRRAFYHGKYSSST